MFEIWLNLGIQEFQSSGKITFFPKKKVACPEGIHADGLGETHDVE